MQSNGNSNGNSSDDESEHKSNNNVLGDMDFVNVGMNMNDTVDGKDIDNLIGNSKDLPEMEINGILADNINENKGVNGKLEDDAEHEMNETENSNTNDNGNSSHNDIGHLTNCSSSGGGGSFDWGWYMTIYM